MFRSDLVNLGMLLNITNMNRHSYTWKNVSIDISACCVWTRNFSEFWSEKPEIVMGKGIGSVLLCGNRAHLYRGTTSNERPPLTISCPVVCCLIIQTWGGRETALKRDHFAYTSGCPHTFTILSIPLQSTCPFPVWSDFITNPLLFFSPYSACRGILSGAFLLLCPFDNNAEDVVLQQWEGEMTHTRFWSGEEGVARVNYGRPASENDDQNTITNIP